MRHVAHYMFIEFPDRFPQVMAYFVNFISLFGWSVTTFTQINHALETLILIGNLVVVVFTVRFLNAKTRRQKEPKKPANPG